MSKLSQYMEQKLREAARIRIKEGFECLWIAACFYLSKEEAKPLLQKLLDNAKHTPIVPKEPVEKDV